MKPGKLANVTRYLVISLFFLFWMHPTLSAVTVRHFTTNESVSVSAFVQTSISFEHELNMFCDANVTRAPWAAKAKTKGRFLISFKGIWGHPEVRHVPAMHWPVLLGTYQTPELKCGRTDFVREFDLAHRTIVVPDFPHDYIEGNKFFITACVEPMPGYKSIEFDIRPQCSKPVLAVTVLEPARPDLQLTGRLHPNDSTCGFAIEAQVRNVGDTDADAFDVSISRSYNGTWGDSDDRRLYTSERKSIKKGRSLTLSHNIPGPVSYSGCRSVGARRVCDNLRFQVCASRARVDGGVGGQRRSEKNMLDNCQTFTQRAPVWSSDHYNECKRNLAGRPVPTTPLRPQPMGPGTNANLGNIASRILVTKPTAGEKLCRGRTTRITWSMIGQRSPGVEIGLFKNGRRVGPVRDSRGRTVFKNEGYMSWVPPRDLKVGTYTIRVGSAQDPGVTGESNAFRIKQCGIH